MNAERLLKLADGLEKVRRKGWRFDFSTYGDDKDCGHLACAIGWCPVIFPEEWEMLDGEPYLRVNSEGWSLDDGEAFFATGASEFNHLFLPSDGGEEYQQPDLYGGQRLTRRATRKQVAANIRAFVERTRVNGGREAKPLTGGEK